MSLKQVIQYSCPMCGATQPFTIWNSLNSFVDPEARTNLLAGRLFEFVCDRCTESSGINYPLLYHDPERHFMIWLRSPDDSSSLPSMKLFPFRGIAESNLLRIVNEARYLNEKILIFEAELDDRFVELAKVVTKMKLADYGFESSDSLLFCEADQTEIGSETITFAWFSPTQTRKNRIPIDLYNILAREFGAKLGSVQLGEWLKIDQSYALDIMARYTR